jgi:PAS domain S-box-containing protein
MKDKPMAAKPTREELEQRIRELEKEAKKLTQAEELLRESEERYRTLAENSLVGFWQITLEGHTTYINPAMCSMLEIEGPEALSGQTYHSFFSRKSLETIDRERARRSGGKGSFYEAEIVGKNGGRCNVVICGASLLSAQGKLQGYIATFTDITDRKKTEKELKKAHDRLEYRVRERTGELELKTKSLEEINTAMKVLLKKRQEDKKEIEDNVMTNVKKLVVPYFEKIKKTELDDRQEAFLSIIESNLNEIISPFTRQMSLKYFNLTPTEIRIANLIRYGSPSKKIAELMNVSPRTIDTHRKNIRRKIGLQGQRGNLRSYLLSFD